MDISLSDVLIIDDNPEFTRSLKLLICEVAQQYVSSIHCVNNVLDGIRSMRNNNFEYVFINTDMPNRDGIMAIHLINMAKPDIVIIASSFHKGIYYQFLVENAGANIYIPKDEINSSLLLSIFGDRESIIKKRDLEYREGDI